MEPLQENPEAAEPKSLAARIGRGFVRTVYALGGLLVLFIGVMMISIANDETEPPSGASSSASATQPAPAAPATERSRASRLAGIRSDNSQLSRAVLNFCTHSPDVDQCVLDQWSSAANLALATAQYQPGSTEHRIFSACFDKFATPGAANGTGDYVQIEACASRNPQIRDLIAYLGTLQ